MRSTESGHYAIIYVSIQQLSYLLVPSPVRIEIPLINVLRHAEVHDEKLQTLRTITLQIFSVHLFF